jgi:putative aldouronate transport system permease protein
MKANRISKPANFIINILFLVIMVCCIAPLLLVLAVSFTDEASLQKTGYQFIPEAFSLEPYKYLFNMKDAILQAYGVTIFVTVVGTLLCIALCALYAYPISRKDLKYRRFFTIFLFFTMLFGGGIVPWYLVCTQLLGLQNNIWALIVPSLMNGFYVIVLRTFFMTTIPGEVLESAKMDGANELTTFIRIVVPLSLPALATISIFSAVGFWNDYWLPLMLISDADLYNLQYLIYRVMMNIQFLAENSSTTSSLAVAAATAPKEGARMALAMVTIGPIILIYPYMQKFFIKGLTIGAIKG